MSPCPTYQFGPNAIRDRKTALRIARILETHGNLVKLTGRTNVKGEHRRDAWLIVPGGPLMSPYQKFDPYKSLTPERPAKVAKEGTEKLARPITLAGLATLAAHRAENTNSAFRSIASLQDEADEIHRPFSITPSLTDIPTDWVAGLRAIAERPCPITIEPKRWRQFQGDANRFVDQWGKQAAALGWSTLDIFGCHPTHPADRYDTTMGLVWMIADAEVVAMGAEVANLRKSTGTLQRAWKGPVANGRIHAWDL
jgi:hypothetical protein